MNDIRKLMFDNTVLFMMVTALTCNAICALV